MMILKIVQEPPPMACARVLPVLELAKVTLVKLILWSVGTTLNLREKVNLGDAKIAVARVVLEVMPESLVTVRVIPRSVKINLCVLHDLPSAAHQAAGVLHLERQS
mgnify:CR=1 FL=1